MASAIFGLAVSIVLVIVPFCVTLGVDQQWVDWTSYWYGALCVGVAEVARRWYET